MSEQMLSVHLVDDGAPAITHNQNNPVDTANVELSQNMADDRLSLDLDQRLWLLRGVEYARSRCAAQPNRRPSSNRSVSALAVAAAESFMWHAL